MRNPLSLPDYHPIRRLLGLIVVGTLSTLLAVWSPGVVGVAKAKLDLLLYDTMYRLRPAEPRSDASVAIVAVDDRDLAFMKEHRGFGSIWPRTVWAEMLYYLDRCGAAAVAFDLQFSEPSLYGSIENDDEAFAKMIDEVRVPVVLATKIDPRSGPETLAVPSKRAKQGIVTFRGEGIIRTYYPVQTQGQNASLALAALMASGKPPPAWASEPFGLHFYGPFATESGTTLPYHRASLLWLKANHAYCSRDGADEAERAQAERSLAQLKVDGMDTRVQDAMFKGKIVLIGNTAAGMFDLFTSPLTEQYPGVDMHATAIENMIRGDRVIQSPPWMVAMVAACTALAIAAATIFSRGTAFKLLLAGLMLALLLAAAVALFMGKQIDYLPLASPLLAGGLATVGGLARSFLIEDRRRRVMTKALNQYVSPEVATRLDQNPGLLKIDAEERVMTVMFSDMAGFTDFTEIADVSVLTIVLNAYMEKMSSIVFEEGGTIDKYIGDAIMAFWNAPIASPDHQAAACRAALRICAAEAGVRAEILARKDELRALQTARRNNWPAVEQAINAFGISTLYTRVGINTGRMNVGNWGSKRKFQYTVIGDAVNSAARLEPSNKRYGTRIMLSEATASTVRDAFVLRRLDVLRVKGKTEAMSVYELISTVPAAPEVVERAKRYEAAFALYQQQQWDAAAALLSGNMSGDEDPPSAKLLERIADLRQHPPGPGWDGAYTAKDK